MVNTGGTFYNGISRSTGGVEKIKGVKCGEKIIKFLDKVKT